MRLQLHQRDFRTDQDPKSSEVVTFAFTTSQAASFTIKERTASITGQVTSSFIDQAASTTGLVTSSFIDRAASFIIAKEQPFVINWVAFKIEGFTAALVEGQVVSLVRLGVGQEPNIVAVEALQQEWFRGLLQVLKSEALPLAQNRHVCLCLRRSYLNK